MKILIEVLGGTVTNIGATEDVEIYIVDHDDLKDSWHPAIDDIKNAYEPDEIWTEEDFMGHLNGIMIEYAAKDLERTFK